MRLLFRNNRRDLEFGRDPLGLSDIDIEAITGLQTRPGLYSTVYLQSARGRGQVRSIPGPLEYWICSQPPQERPARPPRRAPGRRRRPMEGAAAAVHAGVAARLPGTRQGRLMAAPAVSLLVRGAVIERTRPRVDRRRRRPSAAAAARSTPPSASARCCSSPRSSSSGFLIGSQPAPGCGADASLPGSWSGPGSLGGVAGTGVTPAELAAARRIPGVGGTRLTPGRLQPDRVLPQPERAADELLVDVPEHGERDPRQQRHQARLPDRVEPPPESVRGAGLHLAQPLRLGGPVRRRRHRQRVQRRRPPRLLHLHGHRPDLAASAGQGLPVGAREHRQRLRHPDPAGRARRSPPRSARSPSAPRRLPPRRARRHGAGAGGLLGSGA